MAEMKSIENRLYTLTQTSKNTEDEIQRLTKEVTALRRELTESAKPTKKDRTKQIYAQVMSTIAAVGALGALVTSILGMVR